MEVEQSLFNWESRDEWRKDVGIRRLSTLGINASNFVNVLTMLVVPTGTAYSPLKSLCHLSSKFLFWNKRTKKNEGTGSTRAPLEWAVKQRCRWNVLFIQCYPSVLWGCELINHRASIWPVKHPSVSVTMRHRLNLEQLGENTPQKQQPKVVLFNDITRKPVTRHWNHHFSNIFRWPWTSAGYLLTACNSSLLFSAMVL